MKRKILQYNMMIGMLMGFTASHAQPHTAQWPFYLAFEDATGASDTIWLLLDESATSLNQYVLPYHTGQDPQFGEVPIELSNSSFNVWIYGAVDVYNDDGIGEADVTWGPFKVSAYPIQQWVEKSIYANNFELPITITWDPALFNADILIQEFGTGMDGALMDSNYFPPDAGFNMLETDHVILPYFEIQGGSGNHFPLFVSITLDPNTISIRDLDAIPVSLHPNPTENTLHISTPENITAIVIRDLNGKDVATFPLQGNGNEKSIDVSQLPSGMYFAIVSGPKGRGVSKFVKR